jgi:hypothetical protein
MSKLRDEFVLDLSLEDASQRCRSAIARIGWNIKIMEPHRIVPKVEMVGVGLTRWPSKIEVLLNEADAAHTTVTLNGSIGVYGPAQKGHLRGQMNRLRNAMEVAAPTSPTTAVGEVQAPVSTPDPHAVSVPESPSPADERSLHSDSLEQLRKLGELRDAGVVTAEEFEAKKAELLGRI